jgi:hypothetical protein
LRSAASPPAATTAFAISSSTVSGDLNSAARLKAFSAPGCLSVMPATLPASSRWTRMLNESGSVEEPSTSFERSTSG